MHNLLALLIANFLWRLAFFLFKYTVVFFGPVSSSKRVGIILGLAYLIPVLWAPFVRETRHRVIAMLIGTVTLSASYILFALEVEWKISGMTFAVGFGLVNPNYKAFFGEVLRKNSTDKLQREYNWFQLSVNLAATLAGIVAAPALARNLDGLRVQYLICSGLTLGFLFVWRTIKYLPIQRESEAPGETRFGIGEGYPVKRLISVLAVIILATLFWVGFEMKTTTLNEFMRKSLCSAEFGISISVTHLQSVNPLAYTILAPLFGLILISLEKRKRLPHELSFMSAGVAVLGVALVCFSLLGSDRNCVFPSSLALIFVIQTIGELLLEPIGLAFIERNSPKKQRTLFFVLWESNSAIGYLLGAYIAVDNVGLFGWLAVTGGLVFFVLGKPLRKHLVE